MTKSPIRTQLSSNPELNELVRKAREAFEALTPEEKAAHRREQAISWVYGEALLTRFERGEPDPTEEEKAAIRKQIEDIVDRREVEKKVGKDIEEI